MPEEVIAAPPATESGGIDSFMSDVMQGVEEAPSTPPAKPPEAKPAETPKEAPKPAIAAKPVPKAEPAKPIVKPAEKPTEKPAEDTNQLRRRHDELLAEKKKTQSEISKLQEENKALAGKRYVTPEMDKEIEDNKAEIKRLKAEFEEAAYERSDTFKKDYVARYQRVQEGALGAVQHFPVTVKRIDENGETQTTTRPSTAADYWKVRNADPGERAMIARELFGDNALTLLTEIRELDRIKSDADLAVKQHGEEHASKAKVIEEQKRGDQMRYQQLRDSARQELVEKYPQFFGPDEADPEASEALANGFQFVDKAMDSNGQMSPDERAAYAEVIRARAAWFPRGFKEVTALRSKITSLETELAKYRSTDPGAAKEKGGVEAKADDDGSGIEGLAARIEREMAG